MPFLSRSPAPRVMSSRQLRLARGATNHPMHTLTRYFTSGQGRPRRDSRDSVQRLEATSIHAHADRLLTYPHVNNLSACEQPIHIVHRSTTRSTRTTPFLRSSPLPVTTRQSTPDDRAAQRSAHNPNLERRGRGTLVGNPGLILHLLKVDRAHIE